MFRLSHVNRMLTRSTLFSSVQKAFEISDHKQKLDLVHALEGLLPLAQIFVVILTEKLLLQVTFFSSRCKPTAAVWFKKPSKASWWTNRFLS